MNRSTIVSFLIAVFGFGILVPWWRGPEVFHATILLASASVSLVFVAPMTASSFSRQQLGGQILYASGFAWIAALLILVNEIVTINVRNWLGHLLVPPLDLLASSLLLNLAGGVFLSLVTMEAALRTGNPAAGIRYVRITFFLILGFLLFTLRIASPAQRSWFEEAITAANLSRIVLSATGLLAVLIVLLWRRVRNLAARQG